MAILESGDSFGLGALTWHRMKTVLKRAGVVFIDVGDGMALAWLREAR